MREKVVDGTATGFPWPAMASLIMVMVPCSRLTLPGKSCGGQLLCFVQNRTGF